MKTERDSSFRLRDNSLIKSIFHYDNDLEPDKFERKEDLILNVSDESIDIDVEEPVVEEPEIVYRGALLEKIFNKVAEFVMNDDPDKYTNEDKLSLYGLWK